MIATDDTQRLRSLFSAGMALTSELSLETVLTRLVEAAAALTGARYAALGVAEAGTTRLERFLTLGTDEDAAAISGGGPAGHGILGVLLREAKPLRIRDLTEDPRSFGFPPNHPPMHSFLGVPILLRGVIYGSLYLTEKADGEAFDQVDEECVTLLAAQAAVAIENARLYEAAIRWSTTLESLTEIGNALATESELGPLLARIADRLRDLLEARLVTVLLPDGDDHLRIAALSGREENVTDQKIARAHSISGRVLATGRSERLDSVLDDPAVDQATARRLGLRTGLWVPLLIRGRPIGVITAHDRQSTPDGRFGDDDLRLTEIFAARATAAVELSERVARDSLRRVVAAQERERHRLARELHDETAQALASILLGLRSLEKASNGNAAFASSLAGLRDLTVGTLRDVRLLAVELRPKTLDDFGLVPALERLAETFGEESGLTVAFESAVGDERFEEEIAISLYRIVQEALINVVKHARAHTVTVSLERLPRSVVVVIRDDGHGFDAAAAGEGYGIEGMRERVGLIGGTLDVASDHTHGTTITAEAPIR